MIYVTIQDTALTICSTTHSVSSGKAISDFFLEAILDSIYVHIQIRYHHFIYVYMYICMYEYKFME